MMTSKIIEETIMPSYCTIQMGCHDDDGEKIKRIEYFVESNSQPTYGQLLRRLRRKMHNPSRHVLKNFYRLTGYG
jgi:hypothetical protein